MLKNENKSTDSLDGLYSCTLSILLDKTPNLVLLKLEL